MISVIIAGGSGTRLWPLSTPDYPKHLLALTGSQAMVNYTYERAKAISKDIYAVTEISHANDLQKLLPDLGKQHVIIEPARRGTANCILAALARISKHHDKDVPIAFMHADHYIRDKAGFTHSLKTAQKLAKQTLRIVLIGVEPDYPATGFGYIQKDGLFDEKLFVYNVHSFKEKPDFATARKYLDSGNYLWNCGYFVATLNTFLQTMERYAPDMMANFERLQSAKSETDFNQVYQSLSSDSIDYALIEKVTDLLVVPANFDWMDLGSYTDLQKAYGGDALGNHVKGETVELEGVENSFIHSDEAKPVAVIGLDNIVVVHTKHGLLVARKDLAQKVGDVSKRFKQDK